MELALWDTAGQEEFDKVWPINQSLFLPALKRQCHKINDCGFCSSCEASPFTTPMWLSSALGIKSLEK